MKPLDGDYGPEAPSNARLLSAHEYRVRMEAWQAQMAEEKERDAQLARDDRAAEAKAKKVKAWIGSVIAVVVGTVTTLGFGQSRIDAGVSAGVSPLKDEFTAHKKADSEDKSALNARLGGVERAVVRSEVMLEMVVHNRGMQPPPKELPDGGS